MAFNNIRINNFTVFDEVELNFCDGINVFIGENGTGKTHLLKILFTLCKWKLGKSSKDNDSNEDNDPSIEEKMLACFQNTAFQELTHQKNKSDIQIVAIIDGQEKTCRLWDNNKPNILLDSRSSGINIAPSPAVFIPAKEMLTHSGLEKDFAQRTLPFDITLIDILNRAGASKLRILADDMRSILDKIVLIIDGKVDKENDRYYIEKPDGTHTYFAVEAEGFKKLGHIYRLIETGNIAKDSILIWDEPESNLNPQLIPALVDIILALEQAGVQMFFATHDYFFAKFLEVRKNAAHQVAYHALYKENDKVLCESQNDFELLENNSIISQSIALYKEEVRKVMV